MIDQWVVLHRRDHRYVRTEHTRRSPGLQPRAAVPTIANITVYVAVEMGKVSRFFFPFFLLLGALILFKAQAEC